MSVPFNPLGGLIVVPAVLEGPKGTVKLRLVVDTGAKRTVIGNSILRQAGYDSALAPQRVQMTTASGVMLVPLLTVNRLSALGKDRVGLPVVAHTLPPAAAFDGLLGLDFIRGMTLTIDFRAGLIDLV
jgi:predicted aspartyl protease